MGDRQVTYSEHFFERQGAGSLSSARILVPLILEYCSPKRVLDIGCGIGTWLSAFAERGMVVSGIDGPWVSPKKLLIPKENFVAMDLQKLDELREKADLVLSLEVAEHLPATAADQFVEALTRSAPLVVFSAAIPYQGGTHHVNEQWPAYWAKKFELRGFIPVDVLRTRVWESPDVEFWYAQNIFLYARRDRLTDYPLLRVAVDAGHSQTLPLVHPRKYLYIAERYEPLRRLFSWIPAPFLRAGKRLLQRRP